MLWTWWKFLYIIKGHSGVFIHFISIFPYIHFWLWNLINDDVMDNGFVILHNVCWSYQAQIKVESFTIYHNFMHAYHLSSLVEMHFWWTKETKQFLAWATLLVKTSTTYPPYSHQSSNSQFCYRSPQLVLKKISK